MTADCRASVNNKAMTRDAAFQALASKSGQAEKFLKAMANAHRLIILCELLEGEANVTALRNAVGLTQSSLSQHVARLRRGGLVKTRRKKREIYYPLLDKRAARMIALLHVIFFSTCRPPTRRSSE
jgi:ArsR family transcriptional regulator, virulence genes transcriptional regulator